MLIDDAERSLTRALPCAWRSPPGSGDPARGPRPRPASGPCTCTSLRVANDDELVVHAPSLPRGGVRALRPLLETLLGEGPPFFSAAGASVPPPPRPAPDVPRWKAAGAARN
jgi:hypothetical protein